MIYRVVLGGIVLAGAALASGERTQPRDDILSNRVHVAASEYGQCYAKSAPDSLYYSQAGRTTLFKVKTATDSIITVYPWYAMFLYIHCWTPGIDGVPGATVVRMGPATRGRLARASDLALALYHNDRLLRGYSTLDLAGRPDHVSASISHYSVIDSVLGFRWLGTNRYGFVVRTFDKKILTFDTETGRLVPAAPKPKE